MVLKTLAIWKVILERWETNGVVPMMATAYFLQDVPRS